MDTRAPSAELAVDHDAHAAGTWEPIASRFRHLPVHLALLHTGKVLAFGGSGNYPPDLHRPSAAELWNPLDGGEVSPVGPPLPSDVFCTGHAFLPDGRLVVAGGTRRYDRQWFGVGIPPFRGADRAYAFDPSSEAWTRLPNLGRGRWYPSLIGLSDGRILAVAGLTKYFPWYFGRSAETFESSSGWTKAPSAAHWLPLYPRLHLVPGVGGRPGGVFYAGTFNTHYTWPFKLKAFPTAILDTQRMSWRKLSLPGHPQREEGTSVLLPLQPPGYRPRVMLIGGGTFRGATVTPPVEVIDLGEEEPTWEEFPAKMGHPRYYPYTVMLPDRSLFVVGGRAGRAEHKHGPPSLHPHEPINGPPQDPLAIREAELLDPDGRSWRPAAPLARDRLYHAGAILLPDGRVMVAGSNPERGSNELSIEIFRPPYLSRGPRPIIDFVPDQVSYGVEFTLQSGQANEVTEVVMMRPAATTHCFDTEQRYVGLPFSVVDATTLELRAPTDPFVAPPGFYMIFILRDGIPSQASFMQLS